MPTLKDLYIERATDGLPAPTDEEVLDETVNAISEHMLGDCDDAEPCRDCRRDMASLMQERRANG